MERLLIIIKMDGYVRLKEWAFNLGFTLVEESGSPKRVVLHCSHYHETIRDTRKIEEADRKRACTTTLSING